MNVKIGLSLISLVFAPALVSAAETPYQHPTLAIPYAWQKPTMDGVINDAEWQGAFSQRALRSLKGQIATRQTRFWMMWDEENIYIAMRSPLRKGERPIQQHRDPSSDSEQIFDDSYEIWLSADQVDTLTGQLDCSAKFLSNVSGAHYDTINQPNVGNERVSSYETGWKPKNRINEKNEWEMELVIPRASLGTTPGPFRDGQQVRTLIARNYKRPWSQDNFEGSSSFSVTDTHSLVILSKTAPALHLLSVGDADKGEVGLRLSAQGQSNMPVAWKFQSPDVTKEGKAQVAKGKLAEVVNNIAMDKAGDGVMRITVTDASGRPLLDWASQRSFDLQRQRVKGADGKPAKDENGKPVFEMVNVANQVFDDKGDKINLEASYNPVRSYLKVRGDFINYDNRAAIQAVEVTVKDSKGKEVGKSTCQLDPYAYARDLISFAKLPSGEYSVLSSCLDKDGKVLETRDKTFTVSDLAEKYDWVDTKRGNIETVIKPWTPVTLKGQTLGVWGRDMTLGAAGLPQQISTKGRNLFAEPGRLVATGADGKRIAATGVLTKTLFDKDYRKTIQVKSKLGDLDVTSDVQVEFDGLYKVTMTLDPKKAITVDKLQVVLPLDEAMADYIHASAALIRAGFYYGSMPEGDGRIWDCISLGDATMTKGSFIPYIWLGSPAGGLAWFADSDEGWVPSDTTPAMEIQRNKAGQVELVLNIIGETFTLDKPRTLTFGLQASPVKEMHDRWREDKWWCGDTFKDYAHNQNLIFASVPFAAKDYIEESKKIVEAQHKAGRPAVPYFIHSVLPDNLVPEMKEMKDEWTTNDGEYGSKSLCYRESLNDYMVHRWGEWARDCGIDGHYVDNMRPIPCNKIEHGCGYRLPDGRIQPIYRIFGTREYFLRSRAAILEERPASKLVMHMTNAMLVPWIGAADVAYDGEHHVIYPRMNKDFMDFWPLDRLRVDVPEGWGIAVNFMHEYQGDWDQADLHRVMRAYIGQVALHDVLPTGNHNGHATHFIKQREAFGIGDKDVTFLGYWQKDTGLSVKGKDIKLGAWLKPDKLMLMVANFGEKQSATVKIDTKELGWGNAAITVTDAEAGYKHHTNRRVEKTAEELAADKARHEQDEANRLAKNPKAEPKPYKQNPWRNEPVIAWNGDENKPVQLKGTTLTVPVERHNYRLLILEKK
jgi:cytochrome c-type biogenesis protein CcmE